MINHIFFFSIYYLLDNIKLLQQLYEVETILITTF